MSNATAIPRGAIRPGLGPDQRTKKCRSSAGAKKERRGDAGLLFYSTRAIEAACERPCGETAIVNQRKKSTSFQSERARISLPARAPFQVVAGHDIEKTIKP